MWQIFLEEEEYRLTKQDMYLAQIAAEVRRTVSKKSVSVKQLILKWTKRTSKAVTKEEAANIAKRKWFGILGLNRDGTNT